MPMGMNIQEAAENGSEIQEKASTGGSDLGILILKVMVEVTDWDKII